MELCLAGHVIRGWQSQHVGNTAGLWVSYYQALFDYKGLRSAAAIKYQKKKARKHNIQCDALCHGERKILLFQYLELRKVFICAVCYIPNC